jgi:aminoglycoside phosphotransferase (APT) family kinase protein
MLTVDNVGPFLLERGLLDHAWIIDGDLTIRSVARRNRNLRLDGPGGAGFLIKQPDDPAESARATLRSEVAFHRFCREEPTVAEVARMIPRLLHDDAENAISVFRLVESAVCLWPRTESEVSPTLIAQAARPLGEALATLHRVLSLAEWEHDPRLAWLSRAKPWVLNFHKPRSETLNDLSAANQQMLRLLQAPDGAGVHLERLSEEWRCETLIHADVRFDNVLVSRPEPNQSRSGVALWIADWEMARFGDPAWDLAGALQDFLVLWVYSMPLSENRTAEELIAGARIPLAILRSAIRALWAGYRDRAGLGSAAADQFLMRAVQYSAARLIQSAFEISEQADQLAGHSVVLLQISANLLSDPGLGQLQLYGIPLSSPGP